MFGRLALISAGLIAATVPATAAIGRRYGGAAGVRFAGASVTALLAQQALVGVAARRHGVQLTLIDAVTLSRGMAASVLIGLLAFGVRHRSGVAGWMGWCSMVYGSIVCDWLDGPIARRTGSTSELGALLDLESDSWLTIAGAAAATGWGGLPAYCRAAPAARYVLLLMALRKMPYSQIYAEEPPWARQTGIAQGALFTAALAPFGGRVTRLTVRLAAPIIASMQLMSMLLLYRRLSQR